VILDAETYEPYEFDKVDNKELLERVKWWEKKAGTGFPAFDKAVIETIVGSYGASIGRTTFDTAIMIGRLEQALFSFVTVEKIPRQTIRAHLCPKCRANDKTVRDALISRFASFDKERGKGTKNKRDFFYGFSADMWSAFAVGVTLIDREKGKDTK
jgi:hypothetical protein